MASLNISELGCLCDAVEPFSKLLAQSGEPVRLYCSLPTWTQTDHETCVDLYDAYDLQSRVLVFLHDVVSALRASGVPADYRLTPSSLPLCSLCALPRTCSATKARSSANLVVQNAKPSKRDNVLLADLQHGPVLIIT